MAVEIRAVLRGITHADVLAAMKDFDAGEIGDFGPPTRYEVVFGGRRYPPKAVVGLAAKRQIGRPLSHNGFSGGNDRWQANGILKALGFQIEAFRPMEAQAGRRSPGAAVDGPSNRYDTDWDDAEVAVAVETYFGMLRLQLEDQPFVKRQIVLGAMPRIPGRTRGALEFKFENVSAVLSRLELTWVVGYRPAQNYQRRLEDAVLDALIADPALARADAAPSEDRGAPIRGLATQDVVVDPPAPGPPALASRPGPRLIRAGWQAARDAANRRLGKAGEEWVVALEHEKLERAGRPDLAKRIDHVSVRVDGYGYDIKSFETDGSELLIEVKTTKADRETPFWLSRNELTTSKANAATFRLFRVFEFGPSARIYVLRGDLEPQLELTPTQYSARRK